MNDSLPQAVLQQEAEADALWKEHFGQAAETPAETPADTPAEPETPEEAPPTAPEPPPAPDGGEWAHKYDVLKGKYDAEVPRLYEEVKYWRDQAERAVAPPRPQEPAADSALTDYLGEDAAKAVQALLEKQREALEARMEQTAQLGLRSAQDRFWDRVRTAFPDYETMRVDPAINSWLTGGWPGSRQTRQQEAQSACESLDSDRFIALLQAYAPAAPPPAAPARTPPTPTPRRAAGSGTPPTGKPALSVGDYETQMDRVIQMRSSGRFQAADALEKTMDQAVAEGRIARK